jgi:peptidoglycan/xylan/chitin deacetylase (PgdA/CDA1 family)
MKQKLLFARQSFFYNHGPFKATLRRKFPRACILAYHRVGEVMFDPYGQLVTPANFEQHLQCLRRYYYVESLTALLEQLPQRSYPDRTIAITFDDGYIDNSTVAYPIAAKLGILFTVFVTVQPILESGRFWWDELAAILLKAPASGPTLAIRDGQETAFFRPGEGDRETTQKRIHTLVKKMLAFERQQILAKLRGWAVPDNEYLDTARPMTVAELQEFSAMPGVTIGVHTMTHPVLSSLSDVDQRHELFTSKAVLEDILGQPVSLISYPFGKPTDISSTTCHLVAQAGYQAAFTTIPHLVGPSAQRYALPRLTVHNWTGDELVKRLESLFGK